MSNQIEQIPAKNEQEIAEIAELAPCCDFCHYSDIIEREEWCKEKFRHFFAAGMLAERERMASCPTIKGWVARDSGPVNAQDLNIGKLKIWPKVPYRNNVGLFWMPNFPQDFAIMMLPSDLFPDLRWGDEPKQVRVIIEEINQTTLK